MSNKSTPIFATMGIDIGKNAFHVIGLDRRGAIVLRQKWSRSQIEARVANMPPCLIGMEACVGAHHLMPQAAVARSRRTTDASKICAPLFEGTEERLP
jgi:transposase